MRVAITIFGSTISPLFDTAQQLLLTEIQAGAVRELGKEPIGALEAPDRLSVLTERGVQVLVCGAINRFFHDALCERGIKVYPWVSGEVSEVLDLLCARWAGGPEACSERLAVTVTQRSGQGFTISSVHGCNEVVLIDGDDCTLGSLNARAGVGGRGCSRLALLLIDANVGVLLTKKCGPNAVGILSAAGVRVISGVEGDLEAAVDHFRRGGPPAAAVEERL